MIVTSPAQLETYGKEVAASAKKVLLHGDLGAWKTTFVKGRVSWFGIDADSVTSPTYTYVNIYAHPTEDVEILHIDMYRMKSYEQVVELWIFDLIDQYEYVVIEWPQRKDEYVDSDWCRIDITKTSETSRELKRSPIE